MAVSSILGLGSRLYFSTDAGSNYTELTDLEMLGSPGSPKVDEIDTTPVNPTARAKEFLAGLIEYGEMSFSQFFTKARYTALRTLLTAGTLVTWKVVIPDNTNPALASKSVFSAILKECALSNLETKKPVTIPCKVRLSGADVFTEGS